MSESGKTTFSKGSKVSADQTLGEIRRLLRQFGAGPVVFGDSDDRISVGFEMETRSIRFVVPLPEPGGEVLLRIANSNRTRTRPQTDAEYQQIIRSRWRALLLVIKAKLESVHSEIETFDEAFMAEIVMQSDDPRYPNGVTMAEFFLPMLPQRTTPLLSIGKEWGDKR